MLKSIILILALIIVVAITYDVVRMYFLFQKTIILEAHLSAFQRIKADAPFKILVLGDSTAVGTGAEKAEDSTAGRLAMKYPDAEVVNLAVNGLRIRGLEKILETRKEDEHFDIVLIQIGANDIIRLTPLKDIEVGIKKILERSSKFGGKIIFLHSGDIGESKFFPWYVRLLLSKRSHEVREIYKKAADSYGASYVDLIDSPVSKVIEENHQRYYSSDKLHLSGEGYGMWFKAITGKLE